MINALHSLKSPLQTPGPIEKAASRARLMAFVLDGESEALLSSCLAQLPVPPPMIRRGGLAGAIRYLGAERSPERIIVDISGAEMPASQLHDLAELCEPGVIVIAIGDKNDIALYRDLVRAGVSEYIVKPVTAQLLVKALIGAPASDEGSPISRKLGKVVAVVGSRGGVGATTLAIHLALHLANQQSRRVMLLDLDLHTGDCALALNLRPTPGLREALANPLRIDSVFLDRTMAIHGERLFVLSAEEPLRIDTEFTAEAVDKLVGVLRTQFHYIVADVPRIPGSACGAFESWLSAFQPTLILYHHSTHARRLCSPHHGQHQRGHAAPRILRLPLHARRQARPAAGTTFIAFLRGLLLVWYCIS